QERTPTRLTALVTLSRTQPGNLSPGHWSSGYDDGPPWTEAVGIAVAGRRRLGVASTISDASYGGNIEVKGNTPGCCVADPGHHFAPEPRPAPRPRAVPWRASDCAPPRTTAAPPALCRAFAAARAGPRSRADRGGGPERSEAGEGARAS